MRVRACALATLIGLVATGGCTALTSYAAGTPENCTNGTDDDLDGARDCDDDECADLPSCEGGATLCRNGMDDDGDEDIDCADPGCDPICGETGVACADTRDNDGDHLTDHLDPDCWAAAGAVSLDRCAAVGGVPIELAATPGFDWRLDPDWPPALATVAGDVSALVADCEDGRAEMRDTPLGLVDGTEVTIHLVLAGWEQPDCFTPNQLVVRLGDPGRGFVEARISVQETWGGGLVYLEDGAATAASPWYGELFEDTRTTGELRFRLDATSVMVFPTLGSEPEGEPLVLARPPTWADDEPLPISFTVSHHAGVTGAEVWRPQASRCGASQPIPELDGHVVLSTAWSSSGEICIATYDPTQNHGRLVSGTVPGDGRLPTLTVGPPLSLRVVALAYADDGSLHGILHDDLRWGSSPRLGVTAGCTAMWEILGPAFPDPPAWTWPGNVRAMHLADADELLLLPHDPEGPILLARGDVMVPGSFTLDPEPLSIASLDQRLGAATAGGAFVLTRVAPGGVAILSSPADAMCTSAACGAVRFEPSAEPTTFDRDGAPPWASGLRWPFGTFAMDPAGPDAGAWRGLFVYEGCTDRRCRIGATWMRVSPP